MNASTQTLLTRFTTLKKKELKRLADDMGLVIPLPELLTCQHHFAAVELRQPTPDELYLFDGIVRRRAGLLSNAELTDVNISDSYILHTYYDMLNKLTALHGKGAPTPGLVNALRLGSAYLAKRNIFPAGGVKVAGDGADSELSVVASNGNTVCYREVRTPTVKGGFLKVGTCFVLLWSPKEISREKYRAAVTHLLDDERITAMEHSTMKVGKFGIAASFIGKCQGVFSDPSRLPFNPSVVLHSAFDGCTMLCVEKQDADTVSAVAEEYGLAGTYFAKATATGRFVTAPASSGDMPPINVPLPVLKLFADGRQSAAFTIPNEDFAAVRPHERLYVKGETAPIESAIHCAGVTMYPVLTVMEKNYFSESLNTVLDALLGIIASGVPYGGATLTLGIRLPDSMSDATENGRSLAMILGVYRAILALGIPEVNSSVSFGSAPASLGVTAFSRTQRKPCPTIVPQNASSLYFIGFARNPDLTPNLESFKQMWTYVFDRFAAGAVLAAAPVTGSLTDTVSAMLTGSTKVTLTNEGNKLNQSFLQGIILQTGRELNIPKLGIIEAEEVLSEGV